MELLSSRFDQCRNGNKLQKSRWHTSLCNKCI